MIDVFREHCEFLELTTHRQLARYCPCWTIWGHPKHSDHCGALDVFHAMLAVGNDRLALDEDEDPEASYADYGTIGPNMLMTRVFTHGTAIRFRHWAMTILSGGRQWADFELVASASKHYWHLDTADAYAELRKLEVDGLLVRDGSLLRRP
jgi:hypothetical protein